MGTQPVYCIGPFGADNLVSKPSLGGSWAFRCFHHLHGVTSAWILVSPAQALVITDRRQAVSCVSAWHGICEFTGVVLGLWHTPAIKGTYCSSGRPCTHMIIHHGARSWHSAAFLFYRWTWLGSPEWTERRLPEVFHFCNSGAVVRPWFAGRQKAGVWWDVPLRTNEQVLVSCESYSEILLSSPQHSTVNCFFLIFFLLELKITLTKCDYGASYAKMCEQFCQKYKFYILQ